MGRSDRIEEHEQLMQYAQDLEELVVDLYAMVAVELETRGFWGFLGRSFERAEISRRMVDLGFVGNCEDDSWMCQNAGSDENTPRCGETTESQVAVDAESAVDAACAHNK